MQQKSIQFKGANVVYHLAGQGPTVLLLHGFGEDGSVFDMVVEHLQHQYQLIVPDIPGTGQSEFIAGADIETYAALVKAIADEENESGNIQINLIGHSMGGYIALAVAEKYPAILSSLGLFHSSAFADTAEKKATRAKAIDFVKEKGAYTFLKTSIPGLFNQEYITANKVHIDDLLNKSKSFSNEAVIQYYEAMINRPERINVLKEFLKPVLFLIGEHDKAIPLQSSLEQCYIPATSYVHILEKSAHMGMYEEPERVLMAVKEFLKHV